MTLSQSKGHAQTSGCVGEEEDIFEGATAGVVDRGKKVSGLMQQFVGVACFGSLKLANILPSS